MEEQLNIGDRVITLQRRGIFRVVARDGAVLTIESDKGGVRFTVHETALRRPFEDTIRPGKE